MKQSIESFVPIDRRLELQKRHSVAAQSSGTILFADISGFTQLTSLLEQSLGVDAGAEELNSKLDMVYGDMIKAVHSYKGCIINFTGDGITCWFDKDSGARGLACALAIRESFNEYKKLTLKTGKTVHLQIKSILTSGNVNRLIVGDEQIQLHDVLTGEAVNRLITGEELFLSGEILVSKEIVDFHTPDIICKGWKTDALGFSFGILDRFTAPVEKSFWEIHPPADPAIVKPWLLHPVYEKLTLEDDNFLAELRVSVNLFLKFTINYNPADINEHQQKLNSFISGVQEIFQENDGYLLQIIVGDKGAYLYGTFGVPISHDNNSRRAVISALAMMKLPGSLPFIKDFQIGITKGIVYAGAYGAPERKTYGVLGNDVNSAARLMQAASPGQVLISKFVARDVESFFNLKKIGNMQLKGITAPFKVYEVDSVRNISGIRALELKKAVVGRKKEFRLLENAIEEVQGGRKRVVMIEGEAGIGKSTIVERLMTIAKKWDFSYYYTMGNTIEKGTSYFAWRLIFYELLNLDDISRIEEVKEFFLELIEDDEYLKEHAPLFNVILPFHFTENQTTRNLQGETRALNTRKAAVRLIKKIVKNSSFLIIFDDTQWLDSASWGLIENLYNEIPSFLLVIANRPFENHPRELKDLMKTGDFKKIELSALASDEIIELVKKRLKTEKLPAEVEELILSKAEGHPFYSEELAYVLKGKGYIVIKDGVCELTGKGRNLKNLDLPNSIKGIMTARLDSLPIRHQNILKVASVIGRFFYFSQFKDIYPERFSDSEFYKHFDLLEYLDLTRHEHENNMITYIFKHMITRDVAYSMLLFSQRRSLHRQLALWYEYKYSSDLAPYYPLLSFHWEKAEEYDRALLYLELSGEKALIEFANEEAAAFYKKAVSLAQDRKQTNVPASKLSIWHFHIGEAYVNCFHFKEAKIYLEKGLRLAGLKVPRNKVSALFSLIKGFFIQYLRRKSKKPCRLLPAEKHELLLTVCLGYEKLVETYYFFNDSLFIIYAILKMLNLSEEISVSPFLGKSYVTMGSIMGFIPARKLAVYYLHKGLDALPRIKDQPAAAYIKLVAASYYLFTAQWDLSEKLYNESLELYLRLEDMRNWETVISNTSPLYFYTGQIPKAVGQVEQMIASSQKRKDDFLYIEGLRLKCYYMVLLNRTEEAAECIKVIEVLLRKKDIINSLLKADYLATEGLLFLNTNQHEKALEKALEVLAFTKNKMPEVSTVYSAFTSPPEIIFTLWRLGIQPEKCRKAAKTALKALASYKSIFLFAEPRYLCFQGYYHWLMGKREKALNFLDAALKSARNLRMVFEEGLALYMKGFFLETEGMDTEDKDNGKAIFNKLGVTYSW